MPFSLQQQTYPLALRCLSLITLPSMIRAFANHTDQSIAHTAYAHAHLVFTEHKGFSLDRINQLFG